MRPSSSGPASTSSSPVDITPTRGRGWHSTSATSRLASTPMCAGVSTVPASNTALAALEVAARGADVIAGARRPVRSRRRRPRRACTSTMTIASAPSGIGAPVMMRIASPAPTATVGALPGRRARRRRAAAPARRRCRPRAPRTRPCRCWRTAAPARARSPLRRARDRRHRESRADGARSGATASRIWPARRRAGSRETRVAARVREGYSANSGPRSSPVERELDVGAQEVELLCRRRSDHRADDAEHGLRSPISSAIASVSCSSPPRPGSMPVERVEDRRAGTGSDRSPRGSTALPRASASRRCRGARTTLGRRLHRRGSAQPYAEISAGGTSCSATTAPPVLLVHVDHRSEQRRVVDHEVVGEQHGERFVADVMPRDRDRVPETERVLLADVVHVGEVRCDTALPSATRASPSRSRKSRARSCGRSGLRLHA